MRILLVATIVLLLGVVSCSSGEASKTESGSDDNGLVAEASETNGSDRLASIKPCDLLTDDEIAAQVDLTYEKGQRDAMHQMNVTHKVSKSEDRSGMGPVCHFSWSSVTPEGDERAKGAFDLLVMTADRLKSVEKMSRPKSGSRAATIPGVGDEAFYLEYAPSARVGDFGVSIAEFPDTREGNGGVELLKAASQRLPK